MWEPNPRSIISGGDVDVLIVEVDATVEDVVVAPAPLDVVADVSVDETVAWRVVDVVVEAAAAEVVVVASALVDVVAEASVDVTVAWGVVDVVVGAAAAEAVVVTSAVVDVVAKVTVVWRAVDVEDEAATH
jgi:hypothetical protein